VAWLPIRELATRWTNFTYIWVRLQFFLQPLNTTWPDFDIVVGKAQELPFRQHRANVPRSRDSDIHAIYAEFADSFVLAYISAKVVATVADYYYLMQTVHMARQVAQKIR
jgi:hypothetical protein